MGSSGGWQQHGEQQAAAAAQPGGEAHTGDPARRCTAPMPPKPPPPTSHSKSVGCQPHPHSGMAPALASMDERVSSSSSSSSSGGGSNPPDEFFEHVRDVVGSNLQRHAASGALTVTALAASPPMAARPRGAGMH